MKKELLKKMSGYSALAVLSAGLPESVEGQIIYTLPESCYTMNCYLDLNHDGVRDFTVDYERSVRSSHSHGTWWSSDFTAEVERTPGNYVAMNTSQWAIPLVAGASIGPALNFNNILPNIVMGQIDSYDKMLSGLWLPNSENFLGLMIKAGGNKYYGWARVWLDEKMLPDIKDFAINLTPNTPIKAGEMDCALLNVDLYSVGPPVDCNSTQIALYAASSIATSYIFYRSGTPISTLPNPYYTATKSGTYYVVAKNSTCTDTSNSVLIGVGNDNPVPLITLYNGKLKSTITNALHYQWYYGTAPIYPSNSPMITPIGNGSYILELTDSLGCEKRSSQFYYELTGINNVATGSEILYTIQNKQLQLISIPPEWLNAQLKVMDIAGRIIYTGEVKDSHAEVTLATYPSGIYFFELKNKSAVVRRKFVLN